MLGWRCCSAENSRELRASRFARAKCVTTSALGAMTKRASVSQKNRKRKKRKKEEEKTRLGMGVGGGRG